MRYISLIYFFLFSLISFSVLCQDVPTPAGKQVGKFAVHGATIHVGNGQIVENGVVVVENGKIASVNLASNYIQDTVSCRIISSKGKHLYPALIGLNTYLGLSEIEAVRATNDMAEQGSLNANVRSIVSYNTDSRVTPTVRSNGVLYAQIVPSGGLMSGTTSLVQLDAWNWEDAAVIPEEGVVLNWPTMLRKMGWWAETKGYEVNKEYEQQRQEIVDYFTEAKAYSIANNVKKNLRFESLKEVIQGKRKLYIQVQHVKEMLHVIEFAEQLSLKIILIGASDSYQIADVLAAKNIPVVLGRTHDLPNSPDEDLHQCYKTPGILYKAGVLFAISNEGFWQVRNLPFQAGQAVPYGLPKEEAIKSITWSAAKILGLDHRLGTIEVGKDASFVISEGDILDMRSSIVKHAFIEGREIDLSNKQTDLYHKFMKKYELESK